MKYLSLIAAAMVGSATVAAASTFGPLTTPEELETALERTIPIILDIRGDAYAEGHIPGAVSAPYSLFRGPAENPGRILEVETLESRFESLGLNFEQPIVIVHEGNNGSNFGAAARVYWTLKSTGFADLTILNGGKLGWQAAGLPLETEAVNPVATDLELSFTNDWTVTTPEVAEFAQASLEGSTESGNTVIVDARPTEFYVGERKHDRASRPGTVPGALNYSQANFFDEEDAFIKASLDGNSLKEMLGIADGYEVVSFCNTGHWAATNWFALSEIAGIDNVKLYPGSMVEYSNAKQPMTNTPGLFQNLKNMLSGG